MLWNANAIPIICLPTVVLKPTSMVFDKDDAGAELADSEVRF